MQVTDEGLCALLNGGSCALLDGVVLSGVRSLTDESLRTLAPPSPHLRTLYADGCDRLTYGEFSLLKVPALPTLLDLLCLLTTALLANTYV